ncbi:MAG: HEAT repeat domain-containing protein [Fuerstiella sp.]
MAIGRVFENQGHYEQAQAMYRRSLRAQPGNSVAQARLQAIASRQSQRSFSRPDSRTQQALAMADSLETRNRQSPVPATPPQPAASAAQPVASAANHMADKLPAEPVAVVEVASSETVTASFDDDDAATVEVDLTMALNNDPAVSAPEVPAIPDQAEADLEIQIINNSQRFQTEVEPAGMAQQAAFEESSGLNFAPALGPAARRKVDTVSFRDTDRDASAWKQASPVITITDIMPWLDAPTEHEADFLAALSYGEDEGVKALAASVLADFPATSVAVDAALRQAAEQGSALVRVTALETLTQRRMVQSGDVQQLLAMVASSNPEIRAQAAGSLRNLAQTEWSAECIAGLGAMLQDPDANVVAMAAATLGDFGAAAASQKPQLMHVLQTTRHDPVAQAVENALSRISGVELIPLPTVTPRGASQVISSEYLPVTE